MTDKACILNQVSTFGVILVLVIRKYKWVYCEDGAHINFTQGYPKYYNSVWSSVVSALKSLWREQHCFNSSNMHVPTHVGLVCKKRIIRYLGHEVLWQYNSWMLFNFHEKEKGLFANRREIWNVMKVHGYFLFLTNKGLRKGWHGICASRIVMCTN